MADVNDDGMADVVGFGNSAVWVARSTGSSFEPMTKWVDGYGYSNGWRVDRHPRFVADVTGDGRADVVGFANPGVYVSISTGSSFTKSIQWLPQFGYNSGWRIDRHPRFLADVTGDERADIVGFGNDGVWIARSLGLGFATPELWVGDFGYTTASWKVSQNPRFVTDVDGDGRADVVGFGPGASHELRVSLSTGTGFAPSTVWAEFEEVLNLAELPDTLAMADLNGDGRSDVVGFGGYEDTYFALSTGSSFTEPRGWIDEYGAHGGWTTADHLRTLADVDGDGRADLVGFGGSGVWVWAADFCFAGGGS